MVSSPRTAMSPWLPHLSLVAPHLPTPSAATCVRTLLCCSWALSISILDPTTGLLCRSRCRETRHDFSFSSRPLFVSIMPTDFPRIAERGRLQYMLLYLPSLSRRCRKISHASSKQQVSTSWDGRFGSFLQTDSEGSSFSLAGIPTRVSSCQGPNTDQECRSPHQVFRAWNDTSHQRNNDRRLRICPLLYRLSSESSPG
ncbi:hypothetical protein B0T11DRAFT_85507 [Plectosphaerella cucumerina]|uniref:Uncharacterized protein n=1 Tax=Plectosphaerella cucumerina TaxID=40658 RepID=A0A8K0TH14_9PEZI|nr:hypothetical protein B0T11DRAFT_85507 [Plectosphaerella cucumerina]